MNTERYHRLSTATGTCADKHMDCMNAWVRKSSDGTFRKKCLSTGAQFKKALERELAYLKSRPPSDRIATRIRQIKDYLAIVDRDLKMLENQNGH